MHQTLLFLFFTCIHDNINLRINTYINIYIMSIEKKKLYKDILTLKNKNKNKTK